MIIGFFAVACAIPADVSEPRPFIPIAKPNVINPELDDLEAQGNRDEDLKGSASYGYGYYGGLGHYGYGLGYGYRYYPYQYSYGYPYGGYNYYGGE